MLVGCCEDGVGEGWWYWWQCWFIEIGWYVVVQDEVYFDFGCLVYVQQFEIVEVVLFCVIVFVGDFLVECLCQVVEYGVLCLVFGVQWIDDLMVDVVDDLDFVDCQVVVLCDCCLNDFGEVVVVVEVEGCVYVGVFGQVFVLIGNFVGFFEYFGYVWFVDDLFFVFDCCIEEFEMEFEWIFVGGVCQFVDEVLCDE